MIAIYDYLYYGKIFLSIIKPVLRFSTLTTRIGRNGFDILIYMKHRAIDFFLSPFHIQMALGYRVRLTTFPITYN